MAADNSPDNIRQHELIVNAATTVLLEPVYKWPSKQEWIKAMAVSGDRRFVPALLRVLEDNVTYEFLQADAACALAEIGDPQAFKAISDAAVAGRLTKWEALLAMGLLSRKDERPIAYLVDVLAHGEDAGVRARAAEMMACSPHLGAVPTSVLDKAMRSDNDGEVRIAAASTLVMSGRDDLVPFLIDATASPEARVRQRAVVSLGCMPLTDRTVSVLLRALADDDPEVAGSAWEILSKEMEEVNCASPPESMEAGRKMAEEYRAAWAARDRE